MIPLIIGLPYDHPHPSPSRLFTYKNLCCYAAANKYYYHIIELEIKAFPYGHVLVPSKQRKTSTSKNTAAPLRPHKVNP